MGDISEPRYDATDQTTSSEAMKILRNSLYLAFYAPKVDDYHRGIFLTYPSSVSDPDRQFSGTLFHAAYKPLTSTDTTSSWTLEQRLVKDITSSNTLVLLFRICTLDPRYGSIDSQCKLISSAISQVPLGRLCREEQLGPLSESEGNPILDGYDCIVWTIDAMDALHRAGILDLQDIGFESAGDLMAMARKAAGPEDAKSMVGVDFGGLRVQNEPR